MLFWILIAVLTGVAALSILVPLSRSDRARTAGTVSADEAVYREQLSAIESEFERGLIDAEAAEAARTETGRRLLAAHDRRAGQADGASRGGRIRTAQVLAVLGLPAAAVGLYLVLGAPGQPDLPLAQRLNAPAEQQSLEVLVARVERHLEQNPQDGQGWSVIAPVYLSLGRAQASAKAYANALRLLGPRQDWLTDMGEALTIANQGLVTADARSAFEKAAALDASAVKPRFFLAIALGQEGKTAEAIAAWETLLENADETAAWVGAARQQLAGLRGNQPAGAPQRGPTQEEVAASQDMAAEDRQAMIKDMVAGLAERLGAEGGSAAEWTQLIRAYMVLGEREKAETALAEAEVAYEGKPEDLSLIKDAASQLGL